MIHPVMSKKSRRILFYMALALFLVLSYTTLLYAQGYKYSFASGKFIKTGSIYLKSSAGARVYLNGSYEGDTSFLGDSFTISKLLPNKYRVELSGENYSKWVKDITVSEGLVSDFRHVIILPTDETSKAQLRAEIDKIFTTPAFSPMAKISSTPVVKKKTIKPTPTSTPTFSENAPVILFSGKLLRSQDGQTKEIDSGVTGFAFSPNRNKVTWRNTNNEVWVIWLKDMDYQPHKKDGDTEKISRFGQTVNRVGWFRGDDHIVVEFKNKNASSSYQILETDTRGGVNAVDF